LGNDWDDERAAGFRAGLARHGILADEADVLLVDEASARRRIRSLLTGTHRGARMDRRPDAIVTGSDRLAAMIYGVAADLRLRIGRDLGVTGFDGSFAAPMDVPARWWRPPCDSARAPATDSTWMRLFTTR